jgi:hypothetical protein
MSEIRPTYLKSIRAVLMGADLWCGLFVATSVWWGFPSWLAPQLVGEVSQALVVALLALLPVYLAVVVVPVALARNAILLELKATGGLWGILQNWSISLLLMVVAISVSFLSWIVAVGAAAPGDEVVHVALLAMPVGFAVYAVGSVVYVVSDGIEFVRRSLK